MTTKTRTYRLADKYGRGFGAGNRIINDDGARYPTFAAALEARTEGYRIETLDKSFRWVPATCTVRVRNVGQGFATVGQLLCGRELVAESDPVGFGFDSAARAAAVAIAAKLGVAIAA
jgi:hypothetical protein